MAHMTEAIRAAKERAHRIPASRRELMEQRFDNAQRAAQFQATYLRPN